MCLYCKRWYAEPPLVRAVAPFDKTATKCLHVSHFLPLTPMATPSTPSASSGHLRAPHAGAIEALAPHCEGSRGIETPRPAARPPPRQEGGGCTALCAKSGYSHR